VRLVVGLGNPGGRYAATRHNVGFRVVEGVAARRRAAAEPPTPEYRWWRADALALLAPVTFMNRSGEAVAAWRERHGLDPGELLVVSDDVYLPLGRLRLRSRGSSGGHRGLESIEAALGSRGYARLRIGVGAAGDSAELREHVLDRFASDEEKLIETAIEQAVDAVECWVDEGMLAAMNRFNRQEAPEP
jgi:PTH1 family peptidyl-tRNA hydrolase